jgi:hypothetical protein
MVALHTPHVTAAAPVEKEMIARATAAVRREGIIFNETVGAQPAPLY